MVCFESTAHLLKPVAALVSEVDLAQLLKQLPSSHFSSAIGATEIGDALGMPYPHEKQMALNLQQVNWGPRSPQMEPGNL